MSALNIYQRILSEWCERAFGSQIARSKKEVSCHCGGDLCVCENYGEMECPRCYGLSAEDYDPDMDYGEPDEPAPSPNAEERK